MSKKTKVVVILTFMVSILAVLSIVFASCSNNSLANTTWQDAEGVRTISFTENTFRWTRKDTDFDQMGTYTVSKDVVVLIFDNIDNSSKDTGRLANGTLSLMAPQFMSSLSGKVVTRQNILVDFHRVR